MVPPRQGAAYELPGGLHQAWAGSGSWGAEGLVMRLAPGHRPPPPTPPTPIDLSVLRV
ncbi:hypothetical protein [Streptomyces sp. NPDC054887]